MNVRVRRNKYNTKNIREGIVRVGWFSQHRYSDGLPVASVAIFNEYGTPRTPARPFVRPVIHGEKQTILENLKHHYKSALRNNTNTSKVLAMIGEDVKWRIQAQILATNTPPNAPSTIKAKGFNKPLYDTGFMLNSISYQTEEVFR